MVMVSCNFNDNDGRLRVDIVFDVTIIDALMAPKQNRMKKKEQTIVPNNGWNAFKMTNASMDSIQLFADTIIHIYFCCRFTTRSLIVCRCFLPFQSYWSFYGFQMWLISTIFFPFVHQIFFCCCPCAHSAHVFWLLIIHFRLRLS